MQCSMTSLTLYPSTSRIHPHGLLPVPRRAATRPLVETTRWALTVRCFAAPMRRTRTIPVPMPIASPALTLGKQQELEAHLGKEENVHLVSKTKDSGGAETEFSFSYSNYPDVVAIITEGTPSITSFSLSFVACIIPTACCAMDALDILILVRSIS